jgi:carbonic anhydrase/acetyltransferase-like protein (isoleucine patch superfamily)
VQDLAMLHTSKGFPLTIGKGVTVGHRAILHGCTIEDNVLVGMGAILLDGAHIESNVLIGAGSVVTEGKRFPSGSLVLGSPARVVRQLSEEEIEAIRATARKYVDVSRQYKTE